MSSESGKASVSRLSIMMFLQFFIWGAWFTTLGPCLGANGVGAAAGAGYGSAPIAAMIAPLFLGIIADRLFASQAVMGVLLILGGILMCMAPQFAVVPAVGPDVTAEMAAQVAAENSKILGYIFTGHMLCYMPTLGLSNTIAFTNIPSQTDFPKIRVWGTIGWIVAGLLIGFMGWSQNTNIFMIAGIASIILGVYSFTLPNTPPPAKGEPLDFRALFMVDAFKMLTKPAFFVFILCSTLICIPLAYYYGIAPYYFTDIGFEQPASSMAIGQMSEIIFMLLIPFFFRKLGVKWMILIGMGAWVARYALFSIGAADQIAWMMFVGIALHGICYDFFFVTGFIYTDKKAPASIRGQAQSMLVFFTQGIGMFFGFKVAFTKLGDVASHGELAGAIAEGRPEESLSFLQSFGRMFSVNLPDVDAALLAETMGQWKSFWMLPTFMAAGILVLFFVAFWDKSADGDNEKAEEVEEEVADAESEVPLV